MHCFTPTVLEGLPHTNDLTLKSLRKKLNLEYLEFISFNLDHLTSFHLLFQREIPLLQKLEEEVPRHIITICADLMKLDFVRAAKPFTIDPANIEQLVLLTKMYIGPKANAIFSALLLIFGEEHADVQLYFSHYRTQLYIQPVQEGFASCFQFNVLSFLNPVA